VSSFQITFLILSIPLLSTAFEAASEPAVIGFVLLLYPTPIFVLIELIYTQNRFLSHERELCAITGLAVKKVS
jgi:hypothetical protein